MEKETEKKTTDLKQMVLKKIEEEKTQPRTKIWFTFFEGLSWVIWGLLLLVSAVTLSVGLFSFKYSHFLSFSQGEKGVLNFYYLPAFWFFLLGVLIVMALLAFRKTRRGYRYERWQVLGVSTVFCLLVGISLGMLEFGFRFDYWLGQKADFYESREKTAVRFWQKPEEGRMLGFFQAEDFNLINIFSDDSEVIFFDINKKPWQIEIERASKEVLETIKDKKMVMIIGYKLDSERFYACQIFPWVLRREYSYRELQKLKQEINYLSPPPLAFGLEKDLNYLKKKHCVKI